MSTREKSRNENFMHQYTKSHAIYQRLCEVIPGGVNSPVRSCKGMGQPPMVAERGDGDTVYDVDGNAFIDYCCSWGALVFGHAYKPVLDLVQKRMWMGSSFGITTEIEEKLARKVTALMPSIEKIRFVSSGTEATMTAVRVARGYTQREIVIKFAGHYHGHADYFLIQAGSGVAGMCPTASSAGVPHHIVKDMLCLPFNDKEALKSAFEAYGNHIAAVILEPVAGNMGLVPSSPDFLKLLRELTQKHGAVLIFDEVMTCFRVALGGAQELYGIRPDMTALGKIVGGGFPAAAFGGKKEIMDHLAPVGSVYQAGTLSGNPLAMEAGLKTLELLEKPGSYKELSRKTSLITEPVNELIQSKHIKACVQEAGSMFSLFFGKTVVRNMEDVRQLDFNRFAEFFRYMFSHGVYIPPLQQEAWFVSLVHEDKNLIKTRDLILRFLKG